MFNIRNACVTVFDKSLLYRTYKEQNTPVPDEGNGVKVVHEVKQTSQCLASDWQRRIHREQVWKAEFQMESFLFSNLAACADYGHMQIIVALCSLSTFVYKFGMALDETCMSKNKLVLSFTSQQNWFPYPSHPFYLFTLNWFYVVAQICYFTSISWSCFG